MPQRDQLPECNDKGMPLDDFQRDWCSRCLNHECVRSIAGKSRFEQRVSTWEERLFLAPPRMDASDPRFEKIAAQRFLTMDQGRPAEIRSASWVDPSNLEEPVQPSPLPVLPTVSVEIRAAEVSAPVVSAPSPALAPSHALWNAPDQSGKMLQMPPSAAIKKHDPWAAPAPPDPKDQIISPGGTVKLRGPV